MLEIKYLSNNSYKLWGAQFIVDVNRNTAILRIPPYVELPEYLCN